MESKIELRRQCKDRRGSLPSEVKNIYDNCIYENVINSDYFRNANIIFIFVSYMDEVNTHEIIKFAISSGKIICVPKVISKEQGMRSVRLRHFDDLKRGRYGILEPISIEDEIWPSEIDLVLLPGLAFDRNGGRLGYGAGFYDRFLKELKHTTPKIGISYDFQIEDKVPMEAYDMFIDGFITNSEVFIK